MKVTFDNRKSYVGKAREYLLHVADKQAEWVRQGVELICGETSLAYLHWMIIEERACGPPNIDINYLKANTRSSVSVSNISLLFRELTSRFNSGSGRSLRSLVKANGSSIFSSSVVEESCR